MSRRPSQFYPHSAANKSAANIEKIRRQNKALIAAGYTPPTPTDHTDHALLTSANDAAEAERFALSIQRRNKARIAAGYIPPTPTDHTDHDLLKAAKIATSANEAAEAERFATLAVAKAIAKKCYAAKKASTNNRVPRGMITDLVALQAVSFRYLNVQMVKSHVSRMTSKAAGQKEAVQSPSKPGIRSSNNQTKPRLPKQLPKKNFNNKHSTTCQETLAVAKAIAKECYAAKKASTNNRVPRGMITDLVALRAAKFRYLNVQMVKNHVTRMTPQAAKRKVADLSKWELVYRELAKFKNEHGEKAKIPHDWTIPKELGLILVDVRANEQKQAAKKKRRLETGK